MNQLQSNTAASSVRRIHTLEEHRAVLKHVFDTAKERILIVSPFISNSALSADKIPAMIKKAVRRNVEVSVYTDDRLNHDSNGSFKNSADTGIASLVGAGAGVTIVSGIHNKTLIRDNDFLSEGSFNWLSAVRSSGGENQREERTIVVQGKEAEIMIAQEIKQIAESSQSHVARGSVRPRTFPETKRFALVAGIVLLAILFFFSGLTKWVTFAFFFIGLTPFVIAAFIRDRKPVSILDYSKLEECPVDVDDGDDTASGYIPGVRNFDGTYMD